MWVTMLHLQSIGVHCDVGCDVRCYVKAMGVEVGAQTAGLMVAIAATRYDRVRLPTNIMLADKYQPTVHGAPLIY